jgi:hypothetical protein
LVSEGDRIARLENFLKTVVEHGMIRMNGLTKSRPERTYR